MDELKRRSLQSLLGLGAISVLPAAWAQLRAVEVGAVPVNRAYDLTVAETALNITGKPAMGITINGTMPGPVLRFREGDGYGADLDGSQLGPRGRKRTEGTQAKQRLERSAFQFIHGDLIILVKVTE